MRRLLVPGMSVVATVDTRNAGELEEISESDSMTEILAAQDTSIGPAGSRKNADVTAWVAVAAGALGAMLATLDISIVNSALPVIQGEIGATGTEGTWMLRHSRC